MLDTDWMLSELRKRMPHHDIEQIVDGQVVFRFTLNVLSHGKPMAFRYVFADSGNRTEQNSKFGSPSDVVDWIALTVAGGLGVSLLDKSVDTSLITR